MRKSDYPNVHRRWVAVMVILLLLCLLVSVSVCESADVDLGYTSGIWVDSDDSPTGIGTIQICWGWGTPKSCYRFDNAPPQTFNFDQPFLIGTFWHFNWPISGSPITWADLKVTLHFNNPPISPDPTFTFKFNHDETVNHHYCTDCDYSPCEVPGCPDKVTFPSAYPEETFLIGDKIYTLKIVGFEWPDGTLVDYFITQEEKNNYAFLIGTVTALNPGISVTKTADPTSGAPSTDVTFTITVENTGDCTLNPVMVVDTLPVGMSYV